MTKKILSHLLVFSLGISIGVSYSSYKVIDAIRIKKINNSSVCGQATDNDISSGFQDLHYDFNSMTSFVSFKYKNCNCYQLLYIDNNSYFHSHIIQRDNK